VPNLMWITPYVANDQPFAWCQSLTNFLKAIHASLLDTKN